MLRILVVALPSVKGEFAKTDDQEEKPVARLVFISVILCWTVFLASVVTPVVACPTEPVLVTVMANVLLVFVMVVRVKMLLVILERIWTWERVVCAMLNVNQGFVGMGSVH